MVATANASNSQKAKANCPQSRDVCTNPFHGAEGQTGHSLATCWSSGGRNEGNKPEGQWVKKKKAAETSTNSTTISTTPEAKVEASSIHLPEVFSFSTQLANQISDQRRPSLSSHITDEPIPSQTIIDKRNQSLSSCINTITESFTVSPVFIYDNDEEILDFYHNEEEISSKCLYPR